MVVADYPILRIAPGQASRIGIQNSQQLSCHADNANVSDGSRYFSFASQTVAFDFTEPQLGIQVHQAYLRC